MVAVASSRRGRRAARDGAAGRRAGRRLPGAERGAAEGPLAAGPAVRVARVVAGTRRPSGGQPADAGACCRPECRRCRQPTNCAASSSTCVTETPRDATLPALRTLYRNRLMVLAALDVAPTVENEPVLPFATIGAHLSDLADAALAAALEVAVPRVCQDGTRPRLAVIAMGKCGARELNYVSDVDVIFVGEKADALETRGGGGDDAAGVGDVLRSRRGAAARRQGAAHWSARWSRTSPTTSGGPRRGSSRRCSKARPAVGDAELGEQYMAALMPMVWTASEREDFVPEVQAMRRRVEELVPADVRDRELKLGARRPARRRVRGAAAATRARPHRRVAARVVDGRRAGARWARAATSGRDDAANLTASYEFLRLLEHRLQLQRLKRTHMLPKPDDDEAMRWLARAAHMRPDGRQDALGVLREETQAAERASVAAAREAVLSAAAGIRRAGTRTCAGG